MSKVLPSKRTVAPLIGQSAASLMPLVQEPLELVVSGEAPGAMHKYKQLD